MVLDILNSEFCCGGGNFLFFVQFWKNHATSGVRTHLMFGHWSIPCRIKSASSFLAAAAGCLLAAMPDGQLMRCPNVKLWSTNAWKRDPLSLFLPFGRENNTINHFITLVRYARLQSRLLKTDWFLSFIHQCDFLCQGKLPMVVLWCIFDAPHY